MVNNERNKKELKCSKMEVSLDVIRKEDKATSPQPFIKGIHELAKFLRVSPARAQKLKNEKIIPCFQDGRLVLFETEIVLQSMRDYNKEGRGGHDRKRK
jgi:hypothetical protein